MQVVSIDSVFGETVVFSVDTFVLPSKFKYDSTAYNVSFSRDESAAKSQYMSLLDHKLGFVVICSLANTVFLDGYAFQAVLHDPVFRELAYFYYIETLWTLDW